MSLEDKAKEYAREIMGKDIIAARYGELKDAMIMDYKAGYRQALKDMIDRAEELQLPHIRMYKKIAEELSK